MFVLGNILMGLGQVLFWLFQIYSYVLIARAVISWVNADPRNAIVRFIVLFALTIFLQYAVAKTLVDLGSRMSPPATVLR